MNQRLSALVFAAAALASIATSAPVEPSWIATSSAGIVTTSLLDGEAHAYDATLRYESPIGHAITGQARAYLTFATAGAEPASATTLVDVSLVYMGEPIATDTIALVDDETQSIELAADVWLTCEGYEIRSCAEEVTLVIERSGGPELSLTYSGGIHVDAAYEGDVQDANVSVEIVRRL